MRARRHVLAVLSCALTATAGVGACHVFQTPPLGVCGNRIVEAEIGEACEDADPAVCGQPGSDFACLLRCNTVANGALTTCPAGLACAPDGVCRIGRLAFTDSSRLSAGAVRQLVAVDTTGDGRAELVSLSDHMTVHVFDEGLVVQTAWTPNWLVLGDTDFAAPSDFRGGSSPLRPRQLLVASEPSGIARFHLLHGQPDGSLWPALVPQSKFGFGATARIVPGSGVVLDGVQANYLFGLFGGFVGFPTMPDDAAHLVGHIARIESPCQGIGVAYAGDPNVHVVFASDAACAAADITVPSASTPRGVWASDLDADGLDDLVIDAGATYVAFGRSDGAFASTPASDGAGVLGAAAVLTNDVGAILDVAPMSDDGRPGIIAQGSSTLYDSVEVLTPFGDACCPEASPCVCRARFGVASGVQPALGLDIDSDGRGDVVGALNRDSGAAVGAWLRADDTPLDEGYLGFLRPARGPVRGVVAARMDDADPRIDLAFAIEEPGGTVTIDVARGQALAAPGSPQPTPDVFSSLSDLGAESGSLTLLGVLAGGDKNQFFLRDAIQPLGISPPAYSSGGGLHSELTASITVVPSAADATGAAVVVTPHHVTLYRSRESAILERAEILDTGPKTPSPEGALDAFVSAAWDVDGDGLDELVMLGPGAQGGHVVLVGRLAKSPPKVKFDPSIPIEDAIEAPTPYVPSRVAVIDTSGAGAPDALFALTVVTDGARIVRFDRSNGVVARTCALDFVPGAAPLEIGRLRLSPTTEVLIALLASGDVVAFTPNDVGACGLAPAKIVAHVDGARHLAIADFDGDSVEDLAVADATEIHVMRGL